MSEETSPTLMQSLDPRKISNDSDDCATLVEIDRSCRAPLLIFIISGLIWLLIGTGLALIASIKLHNPNFLSGWSWLSFGVVRPAHLNTVIYGFCSETGIAVALWLMCRLCKTPLIHSGIIIIAAVFWNIGLTIGIFGILAGDSTSIEWLELPAYSSPILFISFALIGIWTVIAFRYRREPMLYVSQWYLLAAFFWFPWLYSVANIMLVLEPVHGTLQAAVNWWFAHNVLGLWFTPIGLAAIYYFIPKIIGRPIHSYHLSVFGFWSLALFYNWNGMHHLIGGPLPAWLVTISIVASVMMLIPVVTVAINHHMTMWGHFKAMKNSPTLRFIVVGAMSYTLASLQGIASAIPSYSEVVHFTHHTVAHAHLGMYAFFAMIMFGSMYYIIPRITNREWPSAGLIYIHFWAVFVGMILYIVPLSIGGFLQGLKMNNPDVPFLEVVQMTLPFLKFRTLAGLLMTVGHIAFFANFIWILARCLQPYREPVAMILKGTIGLESKEENS